MRGSLLRRDSKIFSGGEDPLSDVSAGADFAPALTSLSRFNLFESSAEERVYEVHIMCVILSS